jgi:hypothetical protein
VIALIALQRISVYINEYPKRCEIDTKNLLCYWNMINRFDFMYLQTDRNVLLLDIKFAQLCVTLRFLELYTDPIVGVYYNTRNSSFRCRRDSFFYGARSPLISNNLRKIRHNYL